MNGLLNPHNPSVGRPLLLSSESKAGEGRVKAQAMVLGRVPIPEHMPVRTLKPCL